ncbi:MAG: threonine/serine dehydratase [Actinomycetota bacterium]
MSADAAQDRSLVGRSEVEAAATVIDGVVRRTPMMTPGPDFHDGPGDIVLKLELLQHTGSFKPRGALHRALTSEIPDSGLIAASGGNHGLAVAWVGRHLGVPAEIFVPEVSPPAKVAKLHELGATVNVVGALYDDALAACRSRQAETGALDIHAYDHLDTIAGAGTIAREIDEQSGGVDTVLVSLGGGGLASGIAAWCGTDTRVVTVEPETSNCFAAAVGAGEPVDVSVTGVAADSLGARRIGSTNWRTLQAAEARPVTVSDDAIRTAQRRLWKQLQLVAEPGGATAAAALWSGAYVPAADERVAVIVCGANCNPADVV